jgi:hypothetical protein
MLTIKGKWLETIVHMLESTFLNLPCPKQVEFFISIQIHGKYTNFTPRGESSLHGEDLIVVP